MLAPGRFRARCPSAWPAGLALLGGLALLAASDLGPRTVVAEPGNPFHSASFPGFRNFQTRAGVRLSRPRCRVRLTGLGRDALVEVRLDLARPAPTDLTLEVDGRPVAWSASQGTPHQLRLSARADAAGRLELRVAHGEDVRPLAVRGVEARQARPAWPPWPRLAAGALWLLMGAAWAAWWYRPAAAAGGVAVATLLALLGQGFGRLTALGLLPSLLLALGFGLACGWAVERLGSRRVAARLVAASAFLRLVLVAQPSFPCIDVGFHSGMLAGFMAGEPSVSRAPNPDRHAEALPVPYPPLAYALLEPLVRAGAPRESLVRLTLGLLEGSSPVLVLLLGRAAGLSAPAAGAAAATVAVMPEGLLVLAKGILANVLASWLGLASLAVLLRRRVVLAGALLTATLLAHFGHSLLVVPLVAAWLALGAWRRTLAPPEAGRLAAALAGALAVAWFAYYREVVQLALATTSALGASWSAGPSSYGVRWIRAGKIAQDLLLKFGLLPLLAGGAGLRAAARATPALGLLVPWLAVGGGAALAAVLTPVPLRFEYFLVPALGLAVGLLVDTRPDGLATRCLPGGWLAVFALQVALAGWLLTDRFFLISVILESTTWPFPVKL